MRSVQPCSAATCTAVLPSSERAHDGHPSASSRRTASARFHAAAQYSGVHPSRSFTSGGDPCTTNFHPSGTCKRGQQTISQAIGKHGKQQCAREAR